MTTQAVFSDAERWRLVNFRRAAKQVREASIIARGQRIQVRTAPGEPGNDGVYVQLLSEEPFRSLALAVRLVYQQGGPAHFLSVCNILARYGSPDLKNRAAELRAGYLATLRVRCSPKADPSVMSVLDRSTDEEIPDSPKLRS